MVTVTVIVLRSIVWGYIYGVGLCLRCGVMFMMWGYAVLRSNLLCEASIYCVRVIVMVLGLCLWCGVIFMMCGYIYGVGLCLWS